MQRALLLAVLVVLAGCSSVPDRPGDAGPPAETVTDPATGSTTDAPRAETATPDRASPAGPATTDPDERASPATPTETTPDRTTVARSADNPWDDDTVTVGLETNGNDGVDYGGAFEGAVEYWNRNMRYADYAVDLEPVADAAEADLRIEMADTIENCGHKRNREILGCAPRYDRDESVDPPVVVTVVTGYRASSTRDVMIHELGHVLGVTHGEEPAEYMSPTETAYRTAQPNASERAYPWNTSSFAVYAQIDQLPAADRDAASAQVDHAIDYYREHATASDAIPDNVTVRRAENRSEANVIVRFPDDLPTGEDTGAGLKQAGRDTDGDGAIERYARATIMIADLDPEAMGWHVGYWFGRSFGLEESELPAPFRDASPLEKRGEWWTEAPD